MHYLLVDSSNTFFRARHASSRHATPDEKAGMALHITLSAVNAVVKRFNADHIVWALEGRSWRKDLYEPYKANRALARSAQTPAEQEEDTLFWETYDQFTKYLAEQTNCSVIRCATAEADDVIARFIALHPQDTHTIISSDSDFHQLLAENVQQYNGISGELWTIGGIFDDKGNRVVDKKTKEPKDIPDPGWILFCKAMRGDTSDNVFSAYPGVRTRGTKNKVGLQEAYDDLDKRGYNFNNLMLQRWTDHNGVEHRVLDDYQRNRTLIDLTAQPEEIKLAVDTAIREQISHKDNGQIGIRFLKYCGRHQLVKLSESAEQFSRWLSNTYTGVLNEQ